jgi:hypothetical protein
MISFHYLITSRNAAKAREPRYKTWNILRQSAHHEPHNKQNVTDNKDLSSKQTPNHTRHLPSTHWMKLKGGRTYSGSPKYDDVDDAEVRLLLDDWHLQHWLPMPRCACKKDIQSRHLKFTQHLTCLTPRHHLLPLPHTNCQSACPSPEPAPLNGYFCPSRARRSRRAKNRDGKAFHRNVSGDSGLRGSLFIAYMELFACGCHSKNRSTWV